MLDRSVAPPFKTVEGIDVVRARKLDHATEFPVFYINAGSQSVVKLELITRCGSWFETKPGMSFFTSKMLLEGTTDYTSSKIAQYFDFLGAQVEVNPGMDFTSINLYVLKEHYGSALELINEVLNNSIFPEPAFELQRSLKEDSLRVNLEKNQYIASRTIREAVFGSAHPYGKSLQIEDIQHLSTEDLKTFYSQSFFCNPVLILSGMIDEEVLDITMKNLRLPQNFKADSSLEPNRDQVREKMIDKAGSIQSSIRIGKTSIPKTDLDYINLLIVTEILGGYFGSRLMKNIREEKGFTYGIYSNILNLQNASMLIIGTDVKQAHTQETIAEIFKEIEILQEEPVPQDELEAVKNYMTGSFLSSITTPFSLADKFKAIHFHGLDYRFFDTYLNTIKNIDQDVIMRVAREQFNPEQFSTVVVGGLK